jgi:hypothetical protein
MCQEPRLLKPGRVTAANWKREKERERERERLIEIIELTINKER